MGRALERIYGEDRERLLAAIARGGDAALAEDALQDAALAALEAWRAQGVPRSPAAWLTTAARRKLIDRLRRRSAADATAMRLALEGIDTGGGTSVVGEDSRADEAMLRLAVTCCDPALAPEVRVSLALRMVGGMRTGEIARRLCVPEATLAKRLVRARQRIRRRGEVPGDGLAGELACRRESVGLVIEALSAAGQHERAARLAEALGRVD